MSSKTFFTVFLLSLASSLCAESRDSSGKAAITEVYLNYSFNRFENLDNSIENYRKLAPDSYILGHEDFKGFNTYGNTKSDINIFLIGIGISRSENSPKLRLSVGYGTGTDMYRSYGNNFRYRVDTVISQNNDITYIDSFVDKEIRMNHKSEMIYFDASYIWRSRNRDKVRLFGGFGSIVGIGISNTTNIREQIYMHHSPIYPYPNYNVYSTTDNRIEFHYSKVQTSIGMYVPFGLDFQLSRQNNFWNKIYFFEENRFTVRYYHIPEIRSYFSTNLSYSFGLRVNLSY